MNTQTDIFHLCDTVCETGFALHRYLCHGHVEKVCENGLAHRIRKAGVRVEQQHALQVLDENGTVVGDYSADILVAAKPIVEVNPCKALTDEHVAQLLGYLRGCHVEHGLLITFGSRKLQVRKYDLSNAN